MTVLTKDILLVCFGCCNETLLNCVRHSQTLKVQAYQSCMPLVSKLVTTE